MSVMFLPEGRRESTSKCGWWGVLKPECGEEGVSTEGDLVQSVGSQLNTESILFWGVAWCGASELNEGAEDQPEVGCWSPSGLRRLSIQVKQLSVGRQGLTR